MVPVVGGVILSTETANAQIRDLRAGRCLLTSANALEKLLWLDNEARDVGFDLSLLHSQIATTLYNDNGAHRPKRPSQIGLFSIDDEIDARDACRIFLATNETGASRTLYVYPHRFANGAVTAALDRDLESLSLLQETGAVPRIGEAFLWSDDAYRVVPVHPPGGSAIGARPLPTSRDTAIREIEAVAAAFHALGQVHEQGVVHRAIRPETVSIDDPMPPGPGAREAALPRATITGFVSAHIDHAATIAGTLDQGDFADAYAAPEIMRMGSYGFADATSDVYSLSLIALERLGGRRWPICWRTMRGVRPSPRQGCGHSWTRRPLKICGIPSGKV
ncbi:MAG: hypothetical protein M3457_08015 [Chloroflexota bacterium]|nr:hypothetical protein [Chloroflexota bacterium]